MTIAQQIAEREAKIQENLAHIASQRLRYAGFISSANRSCSGIGSKKNQCEQDKIKNRQIANGILSDIESREKNNESIRAQIEQLNKQREAEGQAIINLSNQGLTPAAVQTIATSQAEAATQVATAQARSLELDASTKAASEKTKNLIFLAIFLVVLIAIILIVKSKLKK